MEEQQNNTNQRVVISACLSIIASVLLAKTSIGSLIFTVPLVILSHNIRDTKKAVLVQLSAVLIIAGLFVWDYRGLFQDANLGYLLYSGYLMVLPGVFCILYTAFRDYTASVLRRVVYSSFAVLIPGLVLVIWLSGESGSIPLAGLRTTFDYVIKQIPLFGEVFDINELSQIILSVLLLTMVPVCLAFSVLPVLVAESAFHKMDPEWQNQFSFMKMPNFYAYILIFLLVSAITVSIIGFSQILTLVLWNTVFWLSMHYMLNGMSLYCFWRRKSNALFTASRMLFTIILVNVLPGVGLFVSTVLTVLGLLETWIEFR